MSKILAEIWNCLSVIPVNYNWDVILVILAIIPISNNEIVFTHLIAEMWDCSDTAKEIVTWGKKHKQSDERSGFKQASM